MEKNKNKRGIPPNVKIQELRNEAQKEELSDRRHERNWVGFLTGLAFVSAISIYCCRGEVNFALAILNIASVGLGYFVSQKTKS